jgi:hypothetical protein
MQNNFFKKHREKKLNKNLKLLNYKDLPTEKKPEY